MSERNPLPSIIKAKDVPHLHGAKGMSQESKAAAYDKLRPGVQIEEGQKAERFERMQYRKDDDFGSATVHRRGRTHPSSISVPELPWLRDKSE